MYYLYGLGDWTYILVLLGLVLSLLAQAKVKSTYARYSRIGSRSGMTAAQAAENILYSQGIRGVRIARTAGNLTDNYNPKSMILNLSDSTIHSTSIAAIGVAAHECGHACQHAENYGPLSLRSAFVPAAQFGQTIAWPLIVLGLIINSEMSTILLTAGILAFSLGVLFALITLPVEFNASHRAVRILRDTGMMSEEELCGVKKVLTAAALTYVAAAASSILNLLRILILANGRRRD